MIDGQLIALINERAKHAVEIGKAKGSAPIYDPKRELQILRRVASMNSGPLSKGAIEEIYASIIGACREIQAQHDTATK